jgi:SSS family solute:Na+ symporter
VAISFFLQMMQDYGTDQVTVQRMLAIRDSRGVAKATFFNAGTDFCMIALLLFIGLGMFAVYGQGSGSPPAGMPADSLLAHYIMTRFPAGISGLVISAIFAAAMSSMDSGINSLATVAENDLIRPLRRRPRTEHTDVTTARVLTVALGCAATLLAFSVARIGHLIEAFATFMSLFNAPVLALFVLGFLGARTRLAAWVVGLCVSLPATLWLQGIECVHWIYYFPFSFASTYAVAWLVGLCFPVRPRRRVSGGTA